jgi:hypothetical protein
MKIWELAESSDNRRYGQQKNWSKHKASDFDYPDLPSSMKQLYNRFDNSFVYREVNSIPSTQPCVYFLSMPNDTYKIGETTVRNLHDRLSKAQTYFFDNVILNGIQLCESKSVAKSLEKTLLDYFLGIERPRGREVVEYDSDALVECYIMEYCLSQNVSQIIMDNGKKGHEPILQKK